MVAHAQACHAKYVEREQAHEHEEGQGQAGSSKGKGKGKGPPRVTPASFFVGNVFELEEERSMR